LKAREKPHNNNTHPKKDLRKSIKKESGELTVPAPIEEEKKVEKMYKFKPSLAGLMNSSDSDWASEKDIKSKIQKYLLSNKLYNKEKQVIEIFK